MNELLKRRNNFDIIRLLLALTVMLHHIGSLLNFENLKIFKGNFAVQCFFIISGYLIFGSYSKSKSFYEYVIKRAKRIIPGFYIMIFLTIILGVFVTKFTINKYFGFDLIKFIVGNLLFIQHFGSRCLPGVFENNLINCNVNNALWTLRNEIVFYAIVPIFIFIFRKRIEIGLIIGIISTSLYKVFCINYQDAAIEYVKIDFLQNILFQIDYSPITTSTFFFCGGFLYYKNDSFKKILSKYKDINLFLFFLISISLCYFDLINIYIYPIILSICVIYYSVFPPFKVKISKKIGDLSYGVYIYHCPIIQTLNHFNFHQKYGLPLTILLTLFITLIMAKLSWNLIEKRFLFKSTSFLELSS